MYMCNYLYLYMYMCAVCVCAGVCVCVCVWVFVCFCSFFLCSSFVKFQGFFFDAVRRKSFVNIIVRVFELSSTVPQTLTFSKGNYFQVNSIFFYI